MYDAGVRRRGGGISLMTVKTKTDLIRICEILYFRIIHITINQSITENRRAPETTVERKFPEVG